MPREKPLHERIMAYINAQPGCLCRKRHGTRYGQRGDPDLYGSLHGLHFELEVKKKGEKPTDLQLRRLREWESAGALADWFNDWEDARAVVGAWIEMGREYAAQRV